MICRRNKRLLRAYLPVLAFIFIAAGITALIGQLMGCDPLQTGIVASLGWFLRGLPVDLNIKL